MIEIVEAATPEDIRQIRELFVEYASFLNVDLGFQSFEQELDHLPGKYAPSEGGILLIARIDFNLAGCVALRQLTGDICEMKRLFVRPAFRGTGLGKQLALSIIDHARQLGYLRMRLDTLSNLDSAIIVYQHLGFKKIAPYYPNPLPGALYWEKIL